MDVVYLLIGSDARDFMEVIDELNEIYEAEVAEKPDELS